MSNCLILGSNGFVGRHCIEYFLEKTDWKIIAIERRLSTKKYADRVNVFYTHLTASPISREFLRTFTEAGPIDFIVNLASDTRLEDSVKYPVLGLENNFKIGLGALELAREIKPKIFFQVSSDQVYGASRLGGHKEWEPILPLTPYCLLPSTKIATNDGMVTIKDFDISKHKVISRYNASGASPCSASNKFEYDYNGEIVNISTDCGNISTTPEHKFFRKETVYRVLTVPLLNNGKTPVLRHPHKKIKEICSKSLKVGDYIMSLRYVPNRPSRKKYDPKISRLLGYFVGDGYYSKKRQYLTLADCKLSHIDFYRNLGTTIFGVSCQSKSGKFGTVYKHSTKNCYYLQFANKKLRSLVDLKNKLSIVKDIHNYRNEAILEFIAGFFDAEAHFRYVQNNVLDSVTVYQKDKDIIEEIQFLLRYFGIVSKIMSVKKENRTGFNLRISDNLSLQFVVKKIKSLKVRVNTNFRKMQHKGWNKNFYWSQINKIEKSNYEGKVYDLEVANRGNYAANYFVVHNSASKALQEAMSISYWASYNLPLVILNIQNIIGESQSPEKFIPKIIRQIEVEETVSIYPGDRRYLHARNFADALIFLTQKSPTMFQDECSLPDRYHICGEERFSNLEIAQMIAEIMGKKLKYEFAKPQSNQAGHHLNFTLDGSKIADLGWRQPLSMRDSLERICKFQMRS